MINYLIEFMLKNKARNTREINKQQRIVRKEIKYNIIAIIFFVLALITLLSFTGMNDSFGAEVLSAIKALFGQMYFLAPAFMIGAGFSLLSKAPFGALERVKARWKPIISGSFLILTLSFLAFVNLLFYGADFYEAAKQGLGGGYIGIIFAAPLAAITGPTTAAVILAALIVIALLFIFNISLEAFFAQSFQTLKSFYNYYQFLSYGDKDKKKKSVESFSWHGGADLAEKNNQAKKAAATPSFNVKELKNKNLENKGSNVDFGAEEKNNKIELGIKKQNRIKTKWNKFPLDLLDGGFSDADSGDIGANASIIEKTLANFGMEVEMGKVYVGPTVTQYTLKPAVGIKLSRITTLQNDLALALAASSIRIEAPIPGKALVGIEIPNVSSAIVRLKNLLETYSNYYKNDYYASLKVAMGLDVSGSPYWIDITGFPHILIAGSTGSGKTIFVNSLIMSLIYNNSPEAVKIIMIDPKRVELTLYNGIPHLLAPVIVENEKAVGVLKWTVAEMERRYILFEQSASRDIESYNKKILSSGAEDAEEPLPYIILIIDELADLMSTFPREVEATIVRLAQMSRAVGIHLVVSTQRPSVNVITGLIKANISARVSFRVASLIDSRTILDHSGAEKLLGRGDMLYLSTGTAKPKRLQGCFVSENEVKKVVKWLKENYKEESVMLEESEIKAILPSSIELSTAGFGAGGDEMYEEAKDAVIKAGKASASLLQRRLRVGYARAARLLDLLEEQGIIGPSDGARPRAILVSNNSIATNSIPAYNPNEEAKEENI